MAHLQQAAYLEAINNQIIMLHKEVVYSVELNKISNKQEVFLVDLADSNNKINNLVALEASAV